MILASRSVRDGDARRDVGEGKEFASSRVGMIRYGTSKSRVSAAGKGPAVTRVGWHRGSAISATSSLQSGSDALCIIQDCAVDWEIESAKMATIYEQSHLTIAASSSPSCDNSFLVDRDNSLAKPIVIDCLDDSGQPTIVKARLIPRTGIHDLSEIHRDPWDMHAWTLQENLLSTRLISYSGDEIQWSCKTLTTCECEEELSVDWTGFIPIH
jgi:hypothetical protein